MTQPRPLEGIRIIDMTLVWAGSFCATLLADLGAEVIKVENIHVWQPMTRGGQARPRAEAIAAGPGWATGYPYGVPGERPWNHSPTFVQTFRNKHSVTIDITTEEGRDVFARLVSKSDAMVENNAAGTLEKLQIGPDFLRAAREDLILLRMPAYGSTGPYKYARALGVHLESVVGHTMLRGYPDLDPSYITSIFSGDYAAGAHGAFAVMAALRHRRRTGEGQVLELAQAESAAALTAQAFLDYAWTGNIPDRIGNRSLYGAAPYGVYPCAGGTSEDGEDRWISISVLNDAQWLALRQAMGDPEWSREARFGAAAGRLDAADEIDARISEWTASREDYDLFHRLQAAGVPAAPVLDASRILDDAHVQARELNSPQTLFAGVGPFRFNNPFYKFSDSEINHRKPPPALGEDNEYVYKDILGYSDAEYAAFEASGMLGMDYDPEIP